MIGMIMLKLFLVLWIMIALALITFAGSFGYEFHFMFVQFTFSGAQIVFLGYLKKDLDQRIAEKNSNNKSNKKSIAYV